MSRASEFGAAVIVSSSEADLERETLLQCTVGHDIADALQKCGLSPLEAEEAANRVIAQALKKPTEQLAAGP